MQADINLEASLQKSSPKPASIQILSSRNQQKAKKNWAGRGLRRGFLGCGGGERTMLEAMLFSVKFPVEGSPASKLEVRPSDGFAGDEPFRPPLPLPSAPMFLGEKKKWKCGTKQPPQALYFSVRKRPSTWALRFEPIRKAHCAGAPSKILLKNKIK